MEKNNQQMFGQVKKSGKKSWKFWFSFWLISFFLLLGWTIFLRFQNQGFVGLFDLMKPLVRVMPIDKEKEAEILTAFDIFKTITEKDKEQTFLVLFQNNMEIRPGGGFIGAFGILKIKGEKITHIDVHDTGVFDSRVESGITPPYPMEQYLSIKNWEMRDSNWSPDFPTNAKKAEELYNLQGGTEIFDGVVAVSADILKSFLQVTGPITVEGYPGEYNSENAIIKLEYQVEKGFYQQGIETGKRKYIMKDLAREILARASNLSWGEKRDFIKVIEKHLNEKDIMVFFEDKNLQGKIASVGWSGELISSEKDYLMMVDANLGALKTDLHIKREFEYLIDLSGEKPMATLKIVYRNTARARDWMTSDYLSYLRVYVPEEVWFLSDDAGDGKNVFGKELGKKYVGVVVNVPINSQKTIQFEYELPSEIGEDYSVFLQKQSGVNNTQGIVTIKNKNGELKKTEVRLERDQIIQ